MAETIIKYNAPKESGGTTIIYNNSTSESTSEGGGSSVSGESLWRESTGNDALVPKNSDNVADGNNSVAIGTSTETTNEGELAIGMYNDSVSGYTLFTIGDGTDDLHRHNVIEVADEYTYINNDLSGITANFNTSISSPQAYLSAITANNINVSGKLSTNQLEAVSGYIKTLLSDEITVDYLTVTKAAHFFKLIIDEIKATQGQIIITPANAVLDKVDQLSNGNFRCYYRSKDEDGKEIYNNFEVNDQIVCQTFNAATGTSYNVSNTYYWRLVTATGTTTTSISGETVECHYFDLSDTDKDAYSISDPSAGDNCVLLGNRTDTTRQAAIIISAYNTQFLDKGVKAPSIVQYYGINDYTLETHRRNVISRDFNEFKGAFKTSTGDDIEELLNDIESGATSYLHTAWANSADGSVDFTKNPQGRSYSYIGLCSNHFESDSALTYTDYEWSYNKGASGETGEDAEFYRLVPVIEKAIVDTNGTLGVQFKYNIAHVSGQSVTNVIASASDYWIRFRGDNSSTYYNLSTSTSLPSYTNSSFITNYHKTTSKPTYFTVFLVSGSTATEVDKKVVSVIFDAAATLTITDSINATVQGHTSQIEGLSGTVTSHTNSISKLEIKYSGITSTVSAHTQAINGLEDNVESARTDISTLQQTASGLQSDVSSLRSATVRKNIMRKGNWIWADDNLAADYDETYDRYYKADGTTGYDDIYSPSTYLGALDYYTFSFYLPSGTDVDMSGNRVAITKYANATDYGYNSEETYNAYDVGYSTSDKYVLNGTTYYRYYVTTPKIANRGYYGVNLWGFDGNGDVLFPKLERGGTASQYVVYSSQIKQTAEQISLSVFEVSGVTETKLKRTGIDITSGSIVLDADKTTIVGNLDITDTDNGITVYDADSIARINLQPTDVTSYDTVAGGQMQYTSTTSSGVVSLGYVAIGKAVEISNLRITQSSTLSSVVVDLYCGGNTSTPKVSKTISGGFVYSNGTWISTKSTNIAIMDVDTAGYCYVRIRPNGSTSTVTKSFMYHIGEKTNTYVGKNGFVSQQLPNQYLWLDTEHGFEARKDFCGLRLGGNPKSTSVAASSIDVIGGIRGSAPNYKPAWFSMYNYTPVFQPSSFSYGNVGNIGESRYYYTINPTTDVGICLVQMVLYNGSKKNEGWIVLPPQSTTDRNGDSVALPLGYTVTVCNNCTGTYNANIYVVPYASSSNQFVIWDANRNDNRYTTLNDGQGVETFIHMGDGNWISMHDH